MAFKERSATVIDNLVADFAKVGLSLEILDRPMRFGRGMEDIVQIDITRKLAGTRRSEKFRLYPGHATNLIQICGVDKSSKQLVLMIKEPVREFEETARINKRVTLESVKARNAHTKAKIFQRGNEIVIVQKTTGAIRHFLLGVDERQLFIAQLTGPATTCEQARKSLGKSVEFANNDRRKGSSLDRQGEWFFLATSRDVALEIQKAVRMTRTVIRKKVNIGAFLGRVGGNHHVADELVTMPAVLLPHGFSVSGRGRVFVRGSIRHVDHKTVRFTEWREVVANSEGATASAGASGVFWID